MVSAFADRIDPGDWGRYQSRIHIGTTRILDLLDKNNVKATFFVLGWVAERHPGLVREIHARGHEIGCHSYKHRLIYEMSSEEFRLDTRRARNILEDCLGEKIDGYRAPSYSITPRSIWALDVLAEEGFVYDSSIYPIHHDRYGYPGFSRNATMQVQGDRMIVEIPLSTIRVLGTTIPFGGGGYLRLYPSCLTEWAIGYLNDREEMPAVLYVHPWELDPEQPRLNGKALSLFRHYVNLRDTGGKLSRLLRFSAFHGMGKYIKEAGFLSN
jgi:polysaccharide deacetylase family protein (PEP-CTERM system associated)